MRVMRSTSLTSFCRQGKRISTIIIGTPFSSIVQAHGVQTHNNDALEHMAKIKQRLAKTAIPVQKRSILMGMCVSDGNKLEVVKDVYPPKKAMFNNPFFPKHLYEKKAKKKK